MCEQSLYMNLHINIVISLTTKIHMNIHKDKIVAFVRKGKVVTSSDVARFLKVSWNTAESYLKDLVIDDKLERIKKKGVTLWMVK